MSDDTTHEEGELLQDTDQNEAAADAASDTDETEISDGEHEQESLDLDESKDSEKETPVSKSEETKLKQVKAWQKKIDDGKVTMNDMPADVAWLKDYLNPKHELDTDAVRRVLQEEKEADRFNDLHLQLQDSDLPSEKVSKLNEKFKAFRTKGLSKLDAIEAAMEIAGVDLSQQQVNIKRNKMKLPKLSRKADAQDYAKIYEELPFSEAQKLIPSEILDKMMRKTATTF